MTKTTQERLDTGNEGLGFIYPNKTTSMERKTMAENESSPRREIIDVDAWMNTGGKGFFVKIEGKEYITSIESVKALLSGDKQGVKLGLLKSE